MRGSPVHTFQMEYFLYQRVIFVVILLYFLNHFASFTNYCAIGILLTVKEIMMLPCPKYNFDEKFYTFFVAYSSCAGLSLSGQHWHEIIHSYLVASHRNFPQQRGQESNPQKPILARLDFALLGTFFVLFAHCGFPELRACPSTIIQFDDDAKHCVQFLKKRTLGKP